MTRTIDFRFMAVKNGGDYCRLEPAAGSSPVIRMDESGSIRTSFSARFQIPEKDVNWLTDEIRPSMILNGVTYRLGVFHAATIEEIDDGISKSLQIEAYDKAWIARDHRAESLPYFASGTNYLSAVGSAMASSGIVNIREDPTEEVLAEDREDWDIGTSWLDVANQLLDEINYEHIWFNQDGICMLKPISTPTAANINHILDETTIESMMLPGMQKTSDYYETPNVFICICSNADKSGGMSAVAENTNPQSPLSIENRGRRIATVVTLDNIASQDELQSYANRLVTDSMLTGEIITVQTALLPGYGVGDVTALRYGGMLSICRERAWTMTLEVGGKMTHTLERVVMQLE